MSHDKTLVSQRWILRILLLWLWVRIPFDQQFCFLFLLGAGWPATNQCGKWAAGPAEGGERKREAGPSPREGESTGVGQAS